MYAEPSLSGNQPVRHDQQSQVYGYPQQVPPQVLYETVSHSQSSVYINSPSPTTNVENVSIPHTGIPGFEYSHVGSWRGGVGDCCSDACMPATVMACCCPCIPLGQLSEKTGLLSYPIIVGITVCWWGHISRQIWPTFFSLWYVFRCEQLSDRGFILMVILLTIVVVLSGVLVVLYPRWRGLCLTTSRMMDVSVGREVNQGGGVIVLVVLPIQI